MEDANSVDFDVLELHAPTFDLENLSLSPNSVHSDFVVTAKFGPEFTAAEHEYWNDVLVDWPWLQYSPNVKKLCLSIGVHPRVGLGFRNQGVITPIVTDHGNGKLSSEQARKLGFAGIPDSSAIHQVLNVPNEKLVTNKFDKESKFPFISFVNNPADNLVPTFRVSRSDIKFNDESDIVMHHSYDRFMRLPTIESVHPVLFPRLIPFCLLCNVTTHIWRDCSYRRKQKYGRDMALRLCHYCQRPGHIARDCPMRETVY